MKTHGKTICCGDAQGCSDCTINQAAKSDPSIKAARFAVNSKGRCDFYDGPAKEVILIKSR